MMNSNLNVEDGSEGIISIKGDVYSYGILLVETFTKKKPTDEMFAGEVTLKSWVEDSLFDAVVQVLDADLMIKGKEHVSAKKDCFSSIMALALNCCAELPEERMNMKDALATLRKIQVKFLKDVELD